MDDCNNLLHLSIPETHLPPFPLVIHPTHLWHIDIFLFGTLKDFWYFCYIKSHVIQGVDSSVSEGKKPIFGFNDLLIQFFFLFLSITVFPLFKNIVWPLLDYLSWEIICSLFWQAALIKFLGNYFIFWDDSKNKLSSVIWKNFHTFCILFHHMFVFTEKEHFKSFASGSSSKIFVMFILWTLEDSDEFPGIISCRTHRQFEKFVFTWFTSFASCFSALLLVWIKSTHLPLPPWRLPVILQALHRLPLF